MSNELAITAVTIALRNYLTESLKVPPVPGSLGISKSFNITTLPLHRVREKFTIENVVNLLLYRVEVNAAWRNQSLPGKTRSGESGTPPLALDLDFLITVYGEEDREEVGHFLLGQVMRYLNDFPFIPRDQLKLALPEAGVHEQIERVKVTPRPLSVEELSKLWTVFQTQYRLSAGYLATVVLIDSRAPVRSALPVLTRGKDDHGIDAIAGAPPSLDGARAASGFGAARLGEELVVDGQRLDAAGLKARVRHPLMAASIDLTVTPVSASQVRVALPPLGAGVAAAWPAGIYSVSMVRSTPGQPDYVTNDVPFALAPSITVTPDIQPAHAGKIKLTITATPQIHAGQSVTVIWDGDQIAPASVNVPPPANADAASTVTFTVDTPKGTHRVRLRVDGVDSILMKAIPGGYEFDDAQSVVVLP